MSKKLKDLLNALKNVKEKTIILCGPSMSGKTTVLNKALQFLNLETEYIQNVKHYRGKILSKKIGYTEIEIDDIKSVSKNINDKNENFISCDYSEDDFIDSNVIEGSINNDSCNGTKKSNILFINTKNLIIETRSFNLHRFIGNAIVVKFQKDEFYHHLGKLFYSKDDAFKYFNDKMVGYVFENYPFFINLEDANDCLELISAGENYAALLFFWHCKKVNTKKYFSFKSPNIF